MFKGDNSRGYSRHVKSRNELKTKKGRINDSAL